MQICSRFWGLFLCFFVCLFCFQYIEALLKVSLCTVKCNQLSGQRQQLLESPGKAPFAEQMWSDSVLLQEGHYQQKIQVGYKYKGTQNFPLHLPYSAHVQERTDNELGQ